MLAGENEPTSHGVHAVAPLSDEIHPTPQLCCESAIAARHSIRTRQAVSVLAADVYVPAAHGTHTTPATYEPAAQDTTNVSEHRGCNGRPGQAGSTVQLDAETVPLPPMGDRPSCPATELQLRSMMMHSRHVGVPEAGVVQCKRALVGDVNGRADAARIVGNVRSRHACLDSGC